MSLNDAPECGFVPAQSRVGAPPFSERRLLFFPDPVQEKFRPPLRVRHHEQPVAMSGLRRGWAPKSLATQGLHISKRGRARHRGVNVLGKGETKSSGGPLLDSRRIDSPVGCLSNGAFFLMQEPIIEILPPINPVPRVVAHIRENSESHIWVTKLFE